MIVLRSRMPDKLMCSVLQQEHFMHRTRGGRATQSECAMMVLKLASLISLCGGYSSRTIHCSRTHGGIATQSECHDGAQVSQS